MMEAAEILGFRVCGIDCRAAGERVVQWSQDAESRVVLAANVHMLMEARDDPNLGSRLKHADLSVPDGKPLVWALRLLGIDSGHVRGADLMAEVCAQAQAAGLSVGLYGSTPQTLEALCRNLTREYPALQIPFALAPPFRPLGPSEDRDIVEAIRSSGVRILLVGLGCPTQERWMMDHRGRVPCVMLGVGAAFDFLGGMTPTAPRWMQHAGLEWLFRLATDPGRLWKRYLKNNPRFLVLLGGQLVKSYPKRVWLGRRRELSTKRIRAGPSNGKAP